MLATAHQPRQKKYQRIVTVTPGLRAWLASIMSQLTFCNSTDHPHHCCDVTLLKTASISSKQPFLLFKRRRAQKACLTVPEQNGQAVDSMLTPERPRTGVGGV